ncbi:MAG: M14 family zinc carboxypeptidase, partial [Candidatus Aminicenantales bacterium]
MKRIFRLLTLAILSLSLLVGNVRSKNQLKLPLRFDHYYTYEMMAEALKALHQAYPQLTKLEVAGKSEEGRSIYALTINNPKTGPELQKPGIYVDGNIHGNEIQAGEVCLYLANYLLTNYGRNKELTDLVDKK